ncbi:MAG: RNA polymerase sigma factor, partial [Bacteroidota bacterium]
MAGSCCRLSPMSQHPDYRFIVALRENDSRTLEELYRECSPRITSWVLKNSGTVADARDLFQEALISLHASAHKEGFQLTCPIGALLFTICRNQWINQLRRKKREAEVRKIEAERYTPDSTTVSDYERWEDDHLEKARLDQTLAQLSDTCQQLLKLLGRGVKPAEAAEQL